MLANRQFNVTDVLQFLQNLSGSVENPLVLSGAVMNEAESILRAKRSGHKRSLMEINMHRLMLAYFFNDYDSALSLTRQLLSIKAAGMSPNLFPRIAMEGLVHFAMAAKSGRRRHARKGRSFLRLLLDIQTKGCPNVFHFVVLLEAEYMAVRRLKDTSAVQKAYNKAISSSARLGVMHYQAIANERAGLFFLRNNDPNWASTYLSRAYCLYVEWGAVAKARQLLKVHGSLVNDSDGHRRGTDFRAKENLDFDDHVARSKSADF